MFSKYKKLIILVVLSLLIPNSLKIASASTAGGPYGNDKIYPTFGNGGYNALSYDVNLKYFPGKRFLNSVSTMRAKATKNLSSFNLDLKGLKVKSVLVNQIPVKFKRSGDHELIIFPKFQLSKNSIFYTTISYQGKPNSINSKTSVGWQYSETGGAFVAGEPHAAYTWFPVNEDVTDKAYFSLTATVPKKYQVISNGLKKYDIVKNNYRTVKWQTTNPLAPYLTTVGIDKWKILRGKYKNIPLYSVFAKGQNDKINIEKKLPSVLNVLEKYFGNYPLEAAGGIYIADKINFSLETQTRPIYASWTDLATVVHENAHQWWGDSVSVKTWKDICINECMASYAPKLYEVEKENLDIDNWYLKTVFLRKFNNSFWANKLYNMGAGNEFSSNGVYTKGPLFIHALRKYIGNKAFFTSLKSFQNKYKNSNASMYDFRIMFEKYSKKDLVEFFSQWTGDKVPEDKYLYPGNLNGNSIPNNITSKDIESGLYSSL